MKRSRPDTSTAMSNLIQQVRAALPFEQPRADLCQHSCIGCPKKLMDFLEEELEDRELALEQGESPTLGDIEKLARTSRKIHKVMHRNGLIK